MSSYIDFSSASSAQLAAALGRRLARERLSRNITQPQLATEAGISVRTVRRLESDAGVSLDSFIRVLMALKLQANLALLVPDPAVRPIERVGTRGRERQRARPAKQPSEQQPWSWKDDSGTTDD